MTRLVLVLAAVLGWTAYSALVRHENRKRIFGREPDAFPFPTRDELGGIDLSDAASVPGWCDTFACTEEQLRAAVRHVGTVPSSVRRHLQRRR